MTAATTGEYPWKKPPSSTALPSVTATANNPMKKLRRAMVIREWEEREGERRRGEGGGGEGRGEEESGRA